MFLVFYQQQQKKIALFYTRNNQFDNKIENMIAFTVSAKSIQHLGINFIKHMITSVGEILNAFKDVHLIK